GSVVAGLRRAIVIVVPPVVPAGWIGKSVSVARDAQATAGAVAPLTTSLATGSSERFVRYSRKVLVPAPRPETVAVIVPVPSGCSAELTSRPFSFSTACSSDPADGPVILIVTVSPVVTKSGSGVFRLSI